MVKIVLDTSVIISALRSKTGASNQLLRYIADEVCVPLITLPLFLEYESVLKRAEHRLVTGLSLEEVNQFLSALASSCEPVEVHFQWRPLLKDGNDEMVLEAAVNGHAEVLVTHNVKDFKIATQHFGLQVLRPNEFIQEVLL